VTDLVVRVGAGIIEMLIDHFQASHRSRDRQER
jgi:hypothetical protein